MFDAGQVLLSSWVVEAARSSVLSSRGHAEQGARSAARARRLASLCSRQQIRIVPAYANAHAAWIGEVAGTIDETGDVGWFFLQRLGAFVDAHLSKILPPEELAALTDLAAPDAEQAARVLFSGAFQPVPPPPYPHQPKADAGQPVLCRIAIMGDPHVGLEMADRFAAAMVQTLNNEKADLNVVIGDVSQNGRYEYLERASKIFGSLESPTAVTLGNHDMWNPDGDERTGHEKFALAFRGAKPYRDIVLAAGSLEVRAIVLDSTDPTQSPFPPWDIVSGTFSQQPPETVTGGTFSAEVARWMDSLPPSAGPTFIFLHHPPFPFLGFPPIRFGLDAPSTERLSGLAERVNAAAIFCGHTHRCALSHLGEVPVIEVPCPKEWPFGYGMIEVSKDGWAYNLLPAGLEPAESDARYLIGPRYAIGPVESRSYCASF